MILDLEAERTRIVDLIKTFGVNIVEIEKRSAEQSGNYIKLLSYKDKKIFGIFYWKLEIIEVSFVGQSSILETVSKILTALRSDLIKLNYNRVDEVEKIYLENISNGFKYIINFSSIIRNTN